MKRLHAGLLPVLAAAALLPGCDAQQGAGTPVAVAAADSPAASQSVDAKVLATVNGQPITEEVFQQYMNARQLPAAASASPEERVALLNQLISVELVVQDALDKQLEKQPDVKAAIENQQRNILASAALRKYLSEHPISEQDLKAEYDARVAEIPHKEYHARHILTKTEDEANAIIAQLKKGGDFEKLADEKSLDNSAKNGGDLGWFSTGQMVKEFSDAVAALKKGQYTQKPVKSDFGWHVILLEDVRDTPIPPFSEAKDRVKTLVQSRRAQQYVQDLRAKAKVEIKPTIASEGKDSGSAAAPADDSRENSAPAP